MADEETDTRQDALDEDPYSLEAYDLRKEERRGRRGKRLSFVAKIAVPVLVVAAIVVAGILIYNQVRPPDFASYADQTITLVGVTDEDIEVSVQELSEMDCVQTTASGESLKTSATGQPVVKTTGAYGPLLDTVLQTYGCHYEDFRKIRVDCKDGYYIIIRPERQEGDVIVSIANNKDAYPVPQQPARIILPEDVTARWCYGITQIEFTR